MAAVELEMVNELREEALSSVSLLQAHRLIKIWRVLWVVMTAMRLCEAGADPSAAIANSAPKRRSATWSEGEAVRLVKTAWRAGYRGIAAALAVMWETQLSPIDVRRATGGWNSCNAPLPNHLPD